MVKRLVDYFSKNQIVGGIIFLGLVWVLFEIRSILISLFIAYLLVAAFKPVAQLLQRKGVPKTLAVATPYLASICVAGILVATIAPFFVAQISSLANNFPLYLDRASEALGIPLAAADIQNIVASEAGLIGRNVLTTTSRVFGSILSIIATLAISFYLLLDHERVENTFVRAFPAKTQAKLRKTIFLVEMKLGDWVRGQLILCLFIGVITYIVLSILGVEYALVLAIIAGILEIIPTIGPIVSAVPAVIVAVSINPPLAIFVVAAYILIQQLENHVLVPRVMESVVGLPPSVIIVSILIGGSLLGIPGALLAVPFVSMIVVIARTFFSEEEKN